MTPRRRALAPAVVGVLLLATVPALTPAAQAAYESDYSTRATVTLGPTVHATFPVTLELPVPESGGAITALTASWKEVIPQRLAEQGNLTPVHQSLDTSGCTAEAVCTVQAAIPTARMVNGASTITFDVSNAEGRVSLISRSTRVQNPKPTVGFVTPQDNDTLWGSVTVSADAAASADPAAAPLKGVRFYVDGNLGADAPYLFDDTPPYAVTVPATDIAPVLTSRHLVVVAEDADGNLSQMPAQTKSSIVRRRVTVGPPPDVSWSSPRPDGLITGSLRRGVSLEFHAELPDTAPASPGQPNDPYITGYDVALDGVEIGSSNWTQGASWNNYTANTKLRAIEGWAVPGVESGLTAGRHTVTVRVRTSYGAAATLTSGILVADGVDWGQVRSAGRVVGDGYWVTAGTLHRFTVPVATRVAGTRLAWVGAQAGNQNLLSAGWPCSADPASCPESTSMITDVWAAPPKPGQRTLTFEAQVDGDSLDTLTRTIRVQPAARLSLGVSTHQVRRGRAVRFTGRLTRQDTRTPEVGRSVQLQWRKPNVLRWFTVATKATGTDGTVRFRTRPTANGYYRLRSAQVLGELGPGLSAEEKVYMRR